MMKKFLLVLTLSATAALPADERFFNGGFEETSCPGVAVRSSGAALAETSYGRSLYLGNVTGGVEAKALPETELPGGNDAGRKGFPYCSFELELSPRARYELSFDYMPGNIRVGGEFVIADSRGKILRKRVLPVNNLDWNHVAIPFRPGDDGKAIVTFRIKSPADLGGMAVDNISVRLLGDLLPRWGSGNILIGDGDLPGWFWRISGNAGIACDGKGLAVKTSARETVTVSVKTPSVMPREEYCLRLGGRGDKPLQAVVELKCLDGRQREIGKPLVYHVKAGSGKPFRNNRIFSIPPETMLVQLTVKYQLDGRTSAFLDTPRIFKAQKPKKQPEDGK